MFRFQKTSTDVRVGECSLKQLTHDVETPYYIYDLDGLEHSLKTVSKLTSSHPQILVCYAVKANAETRICKAIIHAGLGCDVVSGGEIRHVKRLGAKPEHLYFSGVGKTIAEIDIAISENIGGFHIESLAELTMIEARTHELGLPARVGIRWNPHTLVKTHPHLHTGGREDKFGLETAQVFEALTMIQHSKSLTLSGIHVHIGSQILDLSVFKTLFDQAKTFMYDVQKKGHHPEYINVGGGLGIFYDNAIGKSEDLLSQYLTLLTSSFAGEPYRVVCELGRSLVGIHGALVSRVLYTKPGSQKKFLICDASMTELIRPVLYGAEHPLWYIAHSQIPSDAAYEVVSPICESGDVFSKAFTPGSDPQYGDILVILGAGAYGAAMASQYNLRPLPKARFVWQDKVVM